MRRRRRSLVLVPAALLSAACTRTRSDDKVAEDALSRDLTLATQMENKPVDPSRPEAAGGGGVCAAQPVPAAPSQARRAEAVALAQRAQQAEVVGDTRAARELFARAAQLDGTDKDVVYHLARADEALGRTGDAAREYCQYLSLVPTGAGAAEANARLASLGAAKKPATPAQGTSTRAAWRSPAPTRVAFSAPRTTMGGGAEQQIASARATRSQSSADAGATRTVTTGEAAGHRAAGAPDAGASAPAVDTATAMPAEAVIASAPSRETTTSAPARPAVRREQSHVARDAAIGAAAGAAVGGIMSHSVKGAGIGAIAGGLLGAVSGRAGSGGFRTPGYAR